VGDVRKYVRTRRDADEDPNEGSQEKKNRGGKTFLTDLVCLATRQIQQTHAGG